MRLGKPMMNCLAYGKAITLQNIIKILGAEDLVNLMKLIGLIGWFCSAKDRALLYSISYFTTMQDYMSCVKENILLYERSSKKRRKVTLRQPTTKRNSRKSQAATCANFIHQKDVIAMKVIESLIRGLQCTLYTIFL